MNAMTRTLLPFDNSPFMTVSEAAVVLRHSETTIRRMCREGHLPAAHLGRKWLIDTSDELPDFNNSQRGPYPAKDRLR